MKIRITKSWLKILLLRNTPVIESVQPDYGSYIDITDYQNAFAFKAAATLAVSSLILIFLYPFYLIKEFGALSFNMYIGDLNYGIKKMAPGLYALPDILNDFRRSNDPLVQTLLTLLVWPVIIVYAAIALPIAIAAAIGLAIVAAVTLPFTLLADGVKALAKWVATPKDTDRFGYEIEENESSSVYGRSFEIKPEPRPTTAEEFSDWSVDSSSDDENDYSSSSSYSSRSSY